MVNCTTRWLLSFVNWLHIKHVLAHIFLGFYMEAKLQLVQPSANVSNLYMG